MSHFSNSDNENPTMMSGYLKLFINFSLDN